jgi:hypothetical protein
MVVTRWFFNSEEVIRSVLSLIPDYLCPPHKDILREFAREMVRYRMAICSGHFLSEEESKKFFDLQDAATEVNEYYMQKIRDTILSLTADPSEKKTKR